MRARCRRGRGAGRGPCSRVIIPPGHLLLGPMLVTYSAPPDHCPFSGLKVTKADASVWVATCDQASLGFWLLTGVSSGHRCLPCGVRRFRCCCCH